jgi:hypothetical protein
MRSSRHVIVIAVVALLGTALPLTAGAAAGPPAGEAAEVEVAGGASGGDALAQPASVRFSDVPERASFAQGVGWMLDEGLTEGFGGPGRYSPSVPLKRGQMALFLWRLMGEPAPLSSPCGFADMVGRTQEQIDATCWLKESGVTTGTNPRRRSTARRTS